MPRASSTWWTSSSPRPPERPLSGDDELAEVAEELDRVAERLADLALDRLRLATDPDEAGGPEAAAEERRITRARRAVEKAAALLAPREDADDDG
jgi:hypothetical protein